jgi:hypothetical protein
MCAPKKDFYRKYIVRLAQHISFETFATPSIVPQRISASADPDAQKKGRNLRPLHICPW